MRILLNPLDPDSIADALNAVRRYQKEFAVKEKEFVKRLAELGVSVATTGFALADYDGVKDVSVTMMQDGTSASVLAYGQTVGFIEFGTGVKFPEWNSSDMEYTPPRHGTYGKGHGKRPKGWYFKINEGSVQHTYGNQPAEAMRTARDVMVEQIIQIAREVWR